MFFAKCCDLLVCAFGKASCLFVSRFLICRYSKLEASIDILERKRRVCKALYKSSHKRHMPPICFGVSGVNEMTKNMRYEKAHRKFASIGGAQTWVSEHTWSRLSLVERGGWNPGSCMDVWSYGCMAESVWLGRISCRR